MKFLLTLFTALFPKEWIKPVFTIILAFGAFKGIDVYLTANAEKAVRIAYNEAHAETIKRIEVMESKHTYFDENMKVMVVDIKVQGSKLDRIDGKTDTIIQLLRK